MFDYIRVILIEMHEAPVTVAVDSIRELTERFSNVTPSLMLIMDKESDDLIATFNAKNKSIEQLKTIIETFNQR